MRGVVPMSVNVASAQIGPQSGSASVWCVTLGKGLHCHRPQFPYLPVSLGIVPPSSGYRVGVGGVMRSAGHSVWHTVKPWSVISTRITTIFVLSLSSEKSSKLLQVTQPLNRRAGIGTMT